MNGSELSTGAHELLLQQQSEWPMLKRGYESLRSVRTRSIELEGFDVTIQFNPGRIASSAAKVDPKSIAERKCFLCDANRPPEQRGVPFGADYLVLANPFPIFPEHFTIPQRQHIPQRLAVDEFRSLLELAQGMSPRYAVFYNGPRCGASAPDHLHFQAGSAEALRFDRPVTPLAEVGPVRIARSAGDHLPNFIRLESGDRDALAGAFERFLTAAAGLTGAPAGEEPMMNVLADFSPAGGHRVTIFPRARHRPEFYFAEGDAKILLSPATAEMAGVITLPIARDFDRLTAEHIRQMYAEVSIPTDTFGELCARLAR